MSVTPPRQLDATRPAPDEDGRALTPARTAPGALWRFGPALLALVAAAAVVPAYRYGIGIDGLSYLAIAEAYAEGEWGRALNAYWSPLYSWLLVPLLAVGVEPLLAATIVGVGLAGGVLVALGHLLRATGASPAASGIAALALVPFTVYAAHYGVFADLLLCALLLAYLAEVTDPRFPLERRVAVRTGLWMALAYLAKLYALPVVAVHLPLVVALRWLRARPDQRRQLLARAGVAVAVAVAGSLPWVVAISAAEGRLTLGTAGAYNVAMVAPESRGNPIHYGGLLEPPSDDAYSAWEIPSTMPADTGSWTESRRAAVFRLRDNMQRNLEEGWRALGTQAGRLLPVAAGVGVVALLVAAARDTRGRLLVVLSLAGVYAGGYLVTWVEERYAWLLVFLFAVPLALLLDRLATRSRRWWPAWGVGAAVLALSLGPALDGLALKWNSGRELDGILAEAERAGLVEPGQDVASADNWQRSAILCYRLDCRYWGQPGTEAPLAELDGAGIERFLVWSEGAEAPGDLPLLGAGSGLGPLRVYAVPADP